MKKNRSIIIILILGCVISCNAQKKEDKKENTMEKFDFEAKKNSKRVPAGIERNGTKILIYDMYYNEFPANSNYIIYKQFHANGNLEIVGKVIGKSFPIGQWIYYDEQGNIIKKVDEDAKFRKIKLDNLLRFMEKEGHINLETKEGFENAIIYDDGSGDKIPSRFIISLTKREKEVWAITIIAQPWNDWTRTIYIIDKDTGEALSKESEQRYPIM